MDPEVMRIQTPRMVSPVLSPLMQAKSRLRVGEKANACPFGCADNRLDEHGYCRHLVGFTNDSEPECKAGRGLMERMVLRKGRRVVQVRRLPAEGAVAGDGEVEDGEPVLEPVLKSDVLVKISTSSRVYRKEVEKAEQVEKPKT